MIFWLRTVIIGRMRKYSFKLLWGVAAGFIAASPIHARPEKTCMAELGVGLPIITTASGSVMVRPWLQAGLGYGYTPATTFNPSVNIDPVRVTLADGNEYKLVGTPSTVLSMLHPYVRIFPTEDNFYIQLSYDVLRVQTTIVTSLYQGDTESLPSALTVLATFRQPLPTISIGRMFVGKIYVINFSMGATYVMNGSADIKITSALPVSVGADVLNLTPLQEVKDKANEAAISVSTELRNKFPFIPSIYLSIGFVI